MLVHKLYINILHVLHDRFLLIDLYVKERIYETVCIEWALTNKVHIIWDCRFRITMLSL
jgi:hypothetical protein